MSWTFDNNLPIYLQIMDRIKLQIISNQLHAGEKLPAVRELAAEAGSIQIQSSVLYLTWKRKGLSILNEHQDVSLQIIAT